MPLSADRTAHVMGMSVQKHMSQLEAAERDEVERTARRAASVAPPLGAVATKRVGTLLERGARAASVAVDTAV